MKYLLTQLLTLLTVITVSCQSQQEKKENDHMKETFEWGPALSCPDLYPMEVYYNRFIYADGSGDGFPETPLYGGPWGHSGGSAVVGDDSKPMPIGLDITWLSFTENKFYTGSFKLPYDSILELFKKGYDDYYWDDTTESMAARHDTYNTIIAGVAPGGLVVVWLQGARFRVEVAHFQAKETTVNMKDFMHRDDLNVTKDEYVKSMMEDEKDVTDNLAKNGIPYGLWDKYRQRFNMRPIIQYDQHHVVRTDKIDIGFFNGENDVMILDRLTAKNEFTKRARIKEIGINWIDSLGFKKQPYYLGIKFNEAEMFKAYKEIYDDDPNQEGELVIEVNRGNDQYRVFLQTKNKKVELLQDKGQIYFAQ